MTVAQKKLCIGLTGPHGLGKGEAVRILEQRGFSFISLSDIVRREAARAGGEAPAARGETVTRGRMQDIGNRLRKEGGAGVLGRLVREQVTAASEARWVIDGIRNPAEVLELRKIAGFSCRHRLRRADHPGADEQRGRATDRTGERELRAALEREWGRGEPEGGSRSVRRCGHGRLPRFATTARWPSSRPAWRRSW